MKAKFLPPREYEDTQYVLGSDIECFHGKRFRNKFSKMYSGSTGIVVPKRHPSHGQKSDQFGIYYWDYERFAKAILDRTPTYFD